MIQNFDLRNALEVAQRYAGIATRQREGYAFIGARGFDIGELPILDLKAYPGERGPQPQLMDHCTAVTQGFGVQRWGRTGTSHWRKQLRNDLVPTHLLEQMDHAGLLLRPEDEIVHFLALASRYRNTPYHVIGSQAGYLFRNRDPRQRSWHGNGTATRGGNAGLGVAFDASPQTKLSPFLVETFRATFRLAHLVWLDDGGTGQLRVVSHAQAKHPGRANDPGRALHHEVVIPEVRALREEGHNIIIDTEWTYGTGQVPNWMLTG